MTSFFYGVIFGAVLCAAINFLIGFVGAWIKDINASVKATCQDLIDEAVKAEREAIAVWLEKECDEQYLADRVRARGQA